MSLGFYPFVLVMPVTGEQRELVSCGEADAVCDQIWDAAKAVIEEKRAPSLVEYKHLMSKKGDDIPYRHGVVLGCADPDEFNELFELGVTTRQMALMAHLAELAMQGTTVPGVAGVLISSGNDAAMAEAGWHIRNQAGRIDCDTSFYDGELRKSEPGPERLCEIHGNPERYALCVMEFYGKGVLNG